MNIHEYSKNQVIGLADSAYSNSTNKLKLNFKNSHYQKYVQVKILKTSIDDFITKLSRLLTNEIM